MSLFEAPGTMPVWSYYAWGLVGVFLVYMSLKEGLTIIDENGHRHLEFISIFELIVGLFLVYYCLNKIHIL